MNSNIQIQLCPFCTSFFQSLNSSVTPRQFLVILICLYLGYNELKNDTLVFQIRLPFLRKLTSKLNVKNTFKFQVSTSADLLNKELLQKASVQFY